MINMKKIIFFLLTIIPVSSAWAQGSFTVRDFYPQYEHSGRVNAVAVDPVTNSNIIVTTETAGPFKSKDWGSNWTPIQFTNGYTNDVKYIVGVPNMVLITTSADYQTNNGGGLWISVGNGAGWRKVSADASGVSLAGKEACGIFQSTTDSRKIAVGMTGGVLKSDDAGSSWRFLAIPGIAADEVIHSVAFNNSIIVAASQRKVWEFAFATSRWTVSLPDIGTQDYNYRGVDLEPVNNIFFLHRI